MLDEKKLFKLGVLCDEILELKQKQKELLIVLLNNPTWEHLKVARSMGKSLGYETHNLSIIKSKFKDRRLTTAELKDYVNYLLE